MLPPNFARGYPSLLREILWSRGFRDEEAVERFLRPSLHEIPNPWGNLKDLDIAVRILSEARERQEQILVYGDYDVDGTTSTCLLWNIFSDLGFKVETFIPHRVREGYGLTAKGVQRALELYPETKVVVSCDCGISSHEGVEILKSRGIRVIVTDHHEAPEERVAADACLNPKQKDCPYPDKKLAGVGVAFLLATGVRRALDKKEYPLRPLLDLVAVGTVCDVAELQGANRVLVKLGLQEIAKNHRPGLQALQQVAGANQRLRAKDLGFVLGPRLNAGGRIGDPDRGLKTLQARDLSEALPMAQELHQLNFARREMQDAQVKEAIKMAEVNFAENPKSTSLVVWNRDFHLGIVGLVASRMTEMFQRPTAVLTHISDEHELAYFPSATNLWKGSLRAPVGFHLAKVLQEIDTESPGFFKSFGGHAQAAGVALEESQLEEFRQRFEEKIAQTPSRESLVVYDAEFQDAEGLEEVLDWLEPIGNGNLAPLVRLKDFKVQDIQVLKGEHLKLWGALSGRNFPVLHFRSPWVSLGVRLRGNQNLIADLLVELYENEWDGRKRIEFLLRDFLDLKVNGESYAFRTNEVRPRASV